MMTTTRSLNTSPLTLAALFGLLLVAVALLVWSAVFHLPAQARRAAVAEEGRQRALYREGDAQRATLMRRIEGLDDLLLVSRTLEPVQPRAASAAPPVRPQASRTVTSRPRTRPAVRPVTRKDPPRIVTPPVRCAICED
jgi:hypothetical protein